MDEARSTSETPTAPESTGTITAEKPEGAAPADAGEGAERPGSFDAEGTSAIADILAKIGDDASDDEGGEGGTEPGAKPEPETEAGADLEDDAVDALLTEAREERRKPAADAKPEATPGEKPEAKKPDTIKSLTIELAALKDDIDDLEPGAVSKAFAAIAARIDALSNPGGNAAAQDADPYAIIDGPQKTREEIAQEAHAANLKTIFAVGADNPLVPKPGTKPTAQQTTYVKSWFDIAADLQKRADAAGTPISNATALTKAYGFIQRNTKRSDAVAQVFGNGKARTAQRQPSGISKSSGRRTESSARSPSTTERKPLSTSDWNRAGVDAIAAALNG